MQLTCITTPITSRIVELFAREYRGRTTLDWRKNRVVPVAHIPSKPERYIAYYFNYIILEF